MLNKKKLIIAFLISFISFINAKLIDDKTKTYLQFEKKIISVDKNGLELSKILKKYVKKSANETEYLEKYFNKEKNEFIINLNFFINDKDGKRLSWAKDIKTNDIKAFAALVDGKINLTDLMTEKLIRLAILADFFCATNYSYKILNPGKNNIEKMTNQRKMTPEEEDVAFIDYMHKYGTKEIAKKLNYELDEDIVKIKKRTQWSKILINHLEDSEKEKSSRYKRFKEKFKNNIKQELIEKLREELRKEKFFVKAFTPSDYFMSEKNSFFKPKRDLLDEIITELSQRIKKQNYLSFFLGKGLIWKLYNELNSNLKSLLKEKLLLQKKPIITFISHEQRLNSLVIAQDGSIVTASNDNTLKKWNPISGKLLIEFKGHKNHINDIISWGDKIVSSSFDGTIKIWNIKTGKTLRSIKASRGEKLISLVLISDKKVACSTSKKKIKIWNLMTGKLEKTLNGHNDWSMPLYFEKNKIASSSYNGTIKVWEIDKKSYPIKLKGHKSRVNDIIFKNDELFSASNNGLIKIWNLKTKKVKRTIISKQKSINKLLIFNDVIISGSSDGTIKVINIETGEILETLKGSKNDWVTSLLVSPVENIVSLFSSGELNVWSPINWKSIKTINRKGHNFSRLTLLPNGSIASSSSDGVINIDNILDIYKDLSFDQFIFVEGIRLKSSNPQDLWLFQKHIFENKEMKNIYLSLPKNSKAKKVIKKLNWLPLFEKLEKN